MHFVIVKQLKILLTKYFAVLFKLFSGVCSYLQRYTVYKYNFRV